CQYRGPRNLLRDWPGRDHGLFSLGRLRLARVQNRPTEFAPIYPPDVPVLYCGIIFHRRCATVPMSTSTSDPQIVVVGSINLDFVVGASHIPSPGETILGNSFQTFFGGKGANQAVAAARLGARVTMIGCVGTDPFGAQLIEGLRRAGVDTQFLKHTEN